MIPLGIAAAVLLLAAVVLVLYFVFGSFLFGAGYQPTPASAVASMLGLAHVGPGDVLYDLGAGTGAIVFRAAEDFGARVVGVKVEPIRMAWLRWRRRRSPARDRIELRRGNIFRVDLREATVVALFLWPGAMARLRPLLTAQLRPGSRVVSHYHPLPDAVPAAVDAANRVYLYVWPQRAAS